MGLDMYLVRRNNNSVYNEETKAMEKANDEEIGYWRKFNALHALILDVTDSFSDTNCKPIDLELEELEHIYMRLRQVNTILTSAKPNEDGTYDENVTELVTDLLPPRSGFFFGSTRIDTWYADDVKDSLPIFEKAIELTKQGEEVYYYCWW